MPNVELPRGDSRVIAIPVFDADLDTYRLVEGTTESGPTLSGLDTVEYVVAESQAGDERYIEKALSGGDVSVVAASKIASVAFDDIPDDAATIRVKLTVADTESLPTEVLWHECQLTDTDGNAITIMTGDFSVTESVTN